VEAAKKPAGFMAMKPAKPAMRKTLAMSPMCHPELIASQDKTIIQRIHTDFPAPRPGSVLP
jgi:hypothetical protein